MTKSEAYATVLQDLQKCSMFTGLYDAKNGSSIFMDGVSTVMEAIAYGVSEEAGDAFTDLFIDNMVKCEKSAEVEPSLKAIKRQIDEHWYLDPPSADSVSFEDAMEIRNTILFREYMRGRRDAEAEWIPCSDGLPDVDVEVLTTTDWSDVLIAWLNKGGAWETEEYILANDEILAWMPLPKPYKGGENE